jgi:hypothetical protein
MAVAVGYRRREAEAYGIDFSSRGRRVDEFLEIVRRLWAGETFSYAGKHFTLKNACIVPTPTRPIPLYIGGFTDKALEALTIRPHVEAGRVLKLSVGDCRYLQAVLEYPHAQRRRAPIIS